MKAPKRHPSPCGGNGGFTLLESMVAGVILLMGSLILLGGFMTAGRMMAHGDSVTRGGREAAADINTGGVETEVSSERQGYSFHAGGFEFTGEGTLSEHQGKDAESVRLFRFTPDQP